MQEAGKALTVEQLRGMDGKPVWVERNEEPHDGKWFIVDRADVENPDKTLYTKEGVTYSDYGTYFTAYACPPAHIDLEKWTAEWKEYGGADAGFHYCSKCKRQAFSYDDGEEVVEVLSNFCPWCGRPLTDEAWAELAKRIGVTV